MTGWIDEAGREGSGDEPYFDGPTLSECERDEAWLARGNLRAVPNTTTVTPHQQAA